MQSSQSVHGASIRRRTRDLRCRPCGRMLAAASDLRGELTIRCPRCGVDNTFTERRASAFRKEGAHASGSPDRAG